MASLTCPQCGAPLPRIALWRSTNCGACGSLVIRDQAIVTRESFRQALNRASHASVGLGAVQCAGGSYQLLQHLSTGEISEVHLALRVDSLPQLVTLKLSSSSGAEAAYAREALAARELQNLDDDGSGIYFSKLLPEVIDEGAVEGNQAKQALVLRHPSGYWGSLAALNEHFAAGIDPRHAVWIWRRILEMLNFVHTHGWCHGDVRPEHALVHPQDHGVRLIGWASATKNASEKKQADDLCRSAKIVQVLLANTSGSLPANVPQGLVQLIAKAGADQDFCRSQGAAGLDKLLQAEARAAFGPPAFVPLTI